MGYSVSSEVAALIESGVVVTARLRETGDGDVYDQFSGLETVSRISVVDSLDILRALQDEGSIRRLETVHEFDSSEYAIKWRAR